MYFTGLPEDSLVSNFPTEVFEDKTATFSCTGYPGYPDGMIEWRVRHENESNFQNFDFYSQISNISDENCRLQEINSVPFQFDMSWNNTYIRCYISKTNYYAEGQIRLLPCKLIFRNCSAPHREKSHLVGKPTMWFPNRSDTNRAVQLQK